MVKAAIRHSLGSLAVAAVSMLSMSCGKKEPPSAGKTDKGRDVPVIRTTTYPTQYFAERIGQDKVLVSCPMPGDQAALLRELNADVIRAFQDADLVVINGAGHENWIEMVFLAKSRIVDTSKPFEKDFIVLKNTMTHSHGPSGAHAHGGIDGHTWLDPVYAKIQAGEIAKAMKKRFPSHAAAFDKNWNALAADLDELHEALSELTKQLGDRPLLASRPAYNYLISRYKWKLTSLDLDPEEMPSDQVFAEIKALLGRFPAKLILWEAYPLEDIAKRFGSDLGLKSVEFSPCELLGDEEIKAGTDYLKVMKANIENLRKALE